jgi:hypothetical protein
VQEVLRQPRVLPASSSRPLLMQSLTLEPCTLSMSMLRASSSTLYTAGVSTPSLRALAMLRTSCEQPAKRRWALPLSS